MIGVFGSVLRLRLEPGEILGYGALLTLCISPIELIRCLAVVAAGVRLYHARIHSESFALHQTPRHAGGNHALENMTQDLALTKAAKPIHRKGRMVWHLVVKVELAEPTVSQMQRHFLAQPALMTDAVTVADQKHPNHQLWIDRGAANFAVKRPQLLMQIRQHRRHEHIDPPQ